MSEKTSAPPVKTSARAEPAQSRAARAEGSADRSLGALGNQSVQALLALGIRRKLAVSEPGDPSEDEADRVADALTSGSTPPVIHRSAAPTLQRKCAACASGAPCSNCQELQRKESSKSKPTSRAAESAVRAVQSGGRALPPVVRSEFESRLGRDLGAVRVHTGPTAAEAARDIHARAYSHGPNIAFASGQYRPDTRDGRHLIAHEVAHVLQSPAAAGTVHRQRTPEEQEQKKEEETFPDHPRQGAWARRTPYFVLSNDLDFMRGEMRRLVARHGLSRAEYYVNNYRPKKRMPIPLPAHAQASGGYGRLLRHPGMAQQELFEDAALLEAFAEVKKDCQAFLATFTSQLRANARDTLAASELRAESEKIRYGASWHQVQTRPERMSKQSDGGWVKEPAEFATRYDLADAASPAVKGLQTAAQVLAARRKALEKLETAFAIKMVAKCLNDDCGRLSRSEITEIQRDYAAIKTARDGYEKLKDVLGFQYPILDRAADRETGSVSALEDIGNPSSERELAEAIGKRIADNLENIAKTRQGIANGNINIWRLHPLVNLTRAQFEWSSDSNLARKKVVEDKIKSEQPNIIDKILEGIALLVLNIGAILLAPATGGLSLVVSAGVSVGLAAKHTIDYIYDKAAAGSDLRRAQALSADEPSLFWLAVEIVGAGLDVGGAVAAMKALGPLAKAAQAAKGKELLETEEAIRKTAKAIGKPDLAETIIKSARKGEKAALEAATATPDEIAKLTALSSKIERGAGETIGSAARTAVGEVKVSRAGHLWACSSPCTMLREKYAAVFAKDKDALAKLSTIEADAAKAAKAREAAISAGDGKAIKAAEGEIARVKAAARELEDGIHAEHFGKPVHDPDLGIAKEADDLAKTGKKATYRGLDPDGNPIDPLTGLSKEQEAAFRVKIDTAGTLDEKLAARFERYQAKLKNRHPPAADPWDFDKWKANNPQLRKDVQRGVELEEGAVKAAGGNIERKAHTFTDPKTGKQVTTITDGIRGKDVVESKYLGSADVLYDSPQLRAQRDLAEKVLHGKHEIVMSAESLVVKPPPGRPRPSDGISASSSEVRFFDPKLGKVTHTWNKTRKEWLPL